ncbi:MAG: GNAT family N-acetyltransferase [Pseudomonadota bacterium]
MDLASTPPPPAGTRPAAALRHAETDGELRACWPVMHQLRPHLQDADGFIGRVQRMRGDRYRILAAWQGESVVALGGYHLMDNFIHGRFLYVDDLVTRDTARGCGWGARLMEEMAAIARQSGCASLVLDTALSNALAQRFYFRQGLLTRAIRFSRELAGEAMA